MSDDSELPAGWALESDAVWLPAFEGLSFMLTAYNHSLDLRVRLSFHNGTTYSEAINRLADACRGAHSAIQQGEERS